MAIRGKAQCERSELLVSLILSDICSYSAFSDQTQKLHSHLYRYMSKLNHIDKSTCQSVQQVFFLSTDRLTQLTGT